MYKVYNYVIVCNSHGELVEKEVCVGNSLCTVILYALCAMARLIGHTLSDFLSEGNTTVLLQHNIHSRRVPLECSDWGTHTHSRCLCYTLHVQ